ncbi:MAG: outer membrane beta-barrel protein [Prevotella sp.]|nr:outer membrane beta-barrel protein [Prevotella sp.]
MKKIALIVVALVMTLSANAQFEQGKGYLGASLSGFDISSQAKKFHINVDVKAGYFFMDNLMGLAEIGYDHLDDNGNLFTIGAYGRYYITQNGIFLGAGLKFRHTDDFNDLVPGVHAGYAFFVSRTVTIEPELYFDLSTKGTDYMNYGLRVGVGVYLFKDQYTLKNR